MKCRTVYCCHNQELESGELKCLLKEISVNALGVCEKFVLIDESLAAKKGLPFPKDENWLHLWQCNLNEAIHKLLLALRA